MVCLFFFYNNLAISCLLVVGSCARRKSLLSFFTMGQNFLKKVIFWVWKILEMLIEIIQYTIQMAMEIWFAAVILIFLLIAWYLGIFN